MKVKTFLQLGTVLVLAQLALARRRAALMCEDNSDVIHMTMEHDNLVACYSVTSVDTAGPCTVEDTLEHTWYWWAYDSPYRYDWTKVWFVECDSDTRAGLCTKHRNGWHADRKCSGNGYEAVISMVRDYGEGEDSNPTIIDSQTRDIGEETWVLLDVPQDLLT